MIGSDGTVDATYAYDPYGHQTSATGTDAGQNLIRYAGPLFDSASSNYSTFGARWYNPVTAFFTTQDTNSYLDNPANGNRYAYATDNPLNYTDPTGRSCTSGLEAGAAAVFLGGTAETGIELTGAVVEDTAIELSLTVAGAGIGALVAGVVVGSLLLAC